MDSSRAVWIAVVLVLLVAGILCFAVRRFLGGRHRAPEPLWSVVLARASVFLVAASGAVSTVVVLAVGFASRPSPNTVVADGPQAPVPDATAPLPLPLPRAAPVEAPPPPAPQPVAFRSPVVPDEPVTRGGRPGLGALEVPVVPAAGDPGVPALAMIPAPRESSGRSVAVPVPRSSDDGSPRGGSGSGDTDDDSEARNGSCDDGISRDRVAGTRSSHSADRDGSRAGHREDSSRDRVAGTRWSSSADRDGSRAGHREDSSRDRVAGTRSSSSGQRDGSRAGHREDSSRDRVAGTRSSDVVDRTGGHRSPDGGGERRVSGERPGRHLAPDAAAGRHRSPFDQGARHRGPEARAESTARPSAPRQESGRHGGAEHASSSRTSAGEE